MVASLAVYFVLKEYLKEDSVKLKLKWINDIFFDDKKIGGVLCTSSKSMDGRYYDLSVGIGVNINVTPSLPTATSLG